MDRYGRRFIAVPSLLIIALSYFLLPVSHNVWTLGAVAVIMGIGNGFGNGVIMTLGADIAPAATRAQFLAAWRLTHDFGMFLGPLAAGAAATVVALGLAIAGLGMVSATGAAVMYRYIPRFVPAPARGVADTVAVRAGTH